MREREGLICEVIWLLQIVLQRYCSPRLKALADIVNILRYLQKVYGRVGGLAGQKMMKGETLTTEETALPRV